MISDSQNTIRNTNQNHLCAECLQQANCAIRAIKKSLLANPRTQNQWETYCFLCFANLYNKNWSQTMEIEQLINF